jgi:hypothetical protein
MINLDEIDFLATKKKSQFRIKTQIGPFICNNREIGEESFLLLKHMKFPMSFTWSYDPFFIIYELRTKHKTTPYVHTQRPEIERCMN